MPRGTTTRFSTRFAAAPGALLAGQLEADDAGRSTADYAYYLAYKATKPGHRTRDYDHHIACGSRILCVFKHKRRKSPNARSY